MTTVTELANKAQKLQEEVSQLREEVARLRAVIFSNTDRKMTMDSRFFVASGAFISDENFDFDAGMMVTGDFVGEEKAEYAKMIACSLNDYCKMKREQNG